MPRPPPMPSAQCRQCQCCTQVCERDRHILVAFPRDFIEDRLCSMESAFSSKAPSHFDGSSSQLEQGTGTGDDFQEDSDDHDHDYDDDDDDNLLFPQFQPAPSRSRSRPSIPGWHWRPLAAAGEKCLITLNFKYFITLSSVLVSVFSISIKISIMRSLRPDAVGVGVACNFTFHTCTCTYTYCIIGLGHDMMT